MSLYETAPNRFERFPFIITCLLLCCILTGTASAGEDNRALALKLYGEGSYEQALPLLEALDAAGEADGTMLYRLYFCQRHLNRPEARRTQERARLQLEKEVDGATSLEVPFYLANAYRNVGRLTDMRRVATTATSRVESGELPEPASGVEMFRLGKLYADIESEERAAEWYGRAVDLLADRQGESAPPYAVWAARFLADRALASGDGEAAAKYFALVPLDGMQASDLDSLAATSCRAGLYGRAREAWLRAERLKPTDANRYRYGRHLAATAESLGGLPDRAPDGRAWTELSKEDLQTLMNDTVQEVRHTVATVKNIYRMMWDVSTIAAEQVEDEALVIKLDGQLETALGKLSERLQPEMDEAKPLFVAACLEFTLNNYGIRETSFFGGFAPLVFNESQWRISDVVAGPPDESETPDAEAPPFGTQAEELVTALREALGEGAAIAKLKKVLAKVEKKIGSR